MKDVYTNTGELFMRRQTDANQSAVNWGNEATTFQTYLLAHMNGQRCTVAEGCLVKFATGAKVISIADVTVTPTGSSALDAVAVTLSAPKIGNFKIVIAPNSVDPTGPATRYSTMFGLTGNEEVAELESILKTK